MTLLHLYHARSIHAIVAAIAIFICIIVIVIWPELSRDKATFFGTIGFFITIYGVVFTIIEVFRVKAVAKLAAKAAMDTAKRIETLYDTRDLAECQILIESALDQLHEERTLSSAALSRIVKLYVTEFSATYELATSPHRRHVGMVNSFAFVHAHSRLSKLNNANNLKSTLVEMMAELSAASGRRVREDLSQ
jgi:hypothetical protein